MIGILDPTIATAKEHIDYVPRPQSLKGLRIGLVENTKKNSEAVLQRLAEKLASAYGMQVEVLVHKPQRAPLKDEQLEELKGPNRFRHRRRRLRGVLLGQSARRTDTRKSRHSRDSADHRCIRGDGQEMAELWGVPGFRFVMMPHPLASLTSAGVDASAEGLIARVIALLKEGQPS